MTISVKSSLFFAVDLHYNLRIRPREPFNSGTRLDTKLLVRDTFVFVVRTLHTLHWLMRSRTFTWWISMTAMASGLVSASRLGFWGIMVCIWILNGTLVLCASKKLQMAQVVSRVPRHCGVQSACILIKGRIL